MLSEQEMTEIRQRADRATPGLWQWNKELAIWASAPDTGGTDIGALYDDGYHMDYRQAVANAAFIAAARTDVPRLLDALTEAYALLARFAHDSDAYRLGREAERKDILDHVREQERCYHATAQGAAPALVREAAGIHRTMCRHLIAWLKGRDETATLPGVWQQDQPSPDTHTPSS